MAHAETEHLGFILATTPGTYRALTGEPDATSAIETTAADLAEIEESARFRSEIAQDLLESLRVANQQATDWLAAIQVASQSEAEADGGDAFDDFTSFTEEETELALYLLDDDSIGNLLRALNLLVASAQQQAAHGIARD